MHDALLIDEILRQIFDFCDRDALADLACSCRAFNEPALDLRWQNLSSIVGLLLLIPGVSVKCGTLVVEDSIKQLDLTVFNRYSTRVKTLDLDLPRGGVQLDDRLQQFFLAGQHIFLPNLETVFFAAHSLSPFTAAFCVSSALREVQLKIRFSSRTQVYGPSEYLRRLDEAGASLQTLGIVGQFHESFNESVPHIASLKSMSLNLGGSLRVDALATLLTSLHLENLHLHAAHIPVHDLENVLAIVEGSVVLPSLRSLRIRCHSDLLLFIISRMSSPGLTALRIDLEDETVIPYRMWRAISSSIGLHCAKLETLFIDHHLDLSEEEDATAAAPQAQPVLLQNSRPSTPGLGGRRDELELALFQDLKHIRSLRQFSLDTTIPFDARDDDVKHLVKWWPRLEYLYLGDSYHHARSTHLTPAAISILADCLPDLKELVMPIRWDSSAISAPSTGSGICGVQCLRLAMREKPEPGQVIPFLRRFPCLRWVDGVPDHAPEHDVQWEEIRQALQVKP